MRGKGLLCVLGMCVMLCACVENEADMQEFVEEVKKTAKGSVSPLPPPTTIAQTTYTAQTLRSPFNLVGGSFVNSPETITSSEGEVIQQQPRPDIKRAREYLEQFPLSSFVMVGTLSKPNASWGLIKDSRGMIHAVKIGDHVGVNSGEIVAITPDQIRINETVPNGRGGWMKSRAVLNLIQAAPANLAAPLPAGNASTANAPEPATAPQQQPAGPNYFPGSKPGGG